MIDDTLTASHVLCSNESHGLKDLALKHLDIHDGDQDALKEATTEARRIGKQLGFDVARPNHPHWPAISTVREGWWVFDTWMPRAVAKHEKYPKSHPWWSVAKVYGVQDAERQLGMGVLYFGDDAALALDTETTGVDLHHGCKPFMVTLAWRQFGKYVTDFYEWDVDPFTREPLIPQKDIAKLQQWITRFGRYYMHNPKFDVRVLSLIGVDVPWGSGLEKSKYKGGALADEKLVGLYQKRRKLLPITYKMESRGVPIRLDLVNKRRQEFQGWHQESVANCEAIVRKLPYYKEELLPKEAAAKVKLAKRRATSKPMELPPVINLRSTDQLRSIMFSKKRGLGLPPGKRAKKGLSTDKDVIKELRDTLDPSHPGFKFIHNLAIVRKASKHLEYLAEYEAAGIPLIGHRNGQAILPTLGTAPFMPKGLTKYQILHCSLNPTGSDTLRFTSGGGGGINIQNVSKLRDITLDKDFNLRTVFCPLPGREFYSADYSNIELRIFAYSCGDKKLIKAFETGWSVHLIIAEVLWPKEFAECKRKDGTGECFKKIYESTLYQWTKNFVFALIYGAGENKADRTAHQHGAYTNIRRRFPLIDRFMESKNTEAKRKGYITTLGGYRLYVPADEPHVAVNYFCQGSAGWAIILAMLRVDDYLGNLNSSRAKPGAMIKGAVSRPNVYGHYMNIQVHDELDFDFPVLSGTAKKPDPMNVMACKELKKLMEQSGNDIGLPTPVEFERHTESWAEGVKVTL